MVNNYAVSKTKLMSCCRTIIAALTIFSFLFGLSMVGTTSVAASSQMIGGGQQPEEEEQQRQRLQMCGPTGGVVDGINANTTATTTTTTTGIDDGNNNNNNSTSVYQNPEYGIQILCPENWIYGEEENLFTGEFQVFFTSLIELQQSERTGETTPTVGVATREVPIANLGLQLFADLNIEELTSEGYEIISTNLNTTLSGMPAFEVVYVDANRTIYLQDWTILGDRAYGVVYVNHESRFQQFLPIAQDMISSFTITVENTGGTTTNTPLSDDFDNGNGTTTVEGEQQQQQQQEVEWLQYENTTYGVRMLYPSNWTQEAGTSTDEQYITVSRFFSPEEVEYAALLVTIENMPQSTNLQDYLNYSIGTFMQDPTFEGFQLLSSSTDRFTLAGIPAYAFEASYAHSEFGSEYMLEVGTIIDGKGYFIQYFADPAVYQRYFPIAERMIESFEITQQQLQQQEDERGQQQQQQEQQLQQPEQGQPQQNQEDSFSAIPGLF
jgi:hypothetical protein